MRYNDAELIALAALAMQEAVGMQGSNDRARLQSDYAPHLNGDMGPYGWKIQDELRAREADKKAETEGEDLEAISCFACGGIGVLIRDDGGPEEACPVCVTKPKGENP